MTEKVTRTLVTSTSQSEIGSIREVQARRSDAQKEMVASGWESYASRRERLREGSGMDVACRNGRMGRDEGISIPGRRREK